MPVPAFPPPRGMLRRPPTRARVLTAAREHALRYGWRQARVQDIAKDAGVSRPTLYKDFPSKQELGEAMVEDVVEGFLADLMAVLEASPPSLHESVRRAVRFTLSRGDDDPFLVAVITGGATASDGLLPLITDQDIPVQSLTSAAVRPWFCQRFPQVPHEVVDFLVDMVVRVSASYLADPPEVSSEATADHLGDLVDAYVSRVLAQEAG